MSTENGRDNPLEVSTLISRVARVHRDAAALAKGKVGQGGQVGGDQGGGRDAVVQEQGDQAAPEVEVVEVERGHNTVSTQCVTRFVMCGNNLDFGRSQCVNRFLMCSILLSFAKIHNPGYGVGIQMLPNNTNKCSQQ